MYYPLYCLKIMYDIQPPGCQEIEIKKEMEGSILYNVWGHSNPGRRLCKYYLLWRVDLRLNNIFVVFT